MAATESTTVLQLLYTHRSITDLARRQISSPASDGLRDAAAGIQKEIISTPSASWAEFGAKACLLINELTTDPTTGWLDAIRESLRADAQRLGAAA